jgi:hypothetical protein
MSERKQLPNGKRVSNHIGQQSRIKTPPTDRTLDKLLAQVYAKFQRVDNPTINSACRRDFVLHMTDWTADLQRLAELYKHPEKYDKHSASDIVAGFLWHAQSHIRAAARLLLDWEPEDTFKAIDGKPKTR